MMNKIFNINNYEFSAEDYLLFDTNIWFYLIGPENNPDKQAQSYFKALHNIQQNSGQVFIDVVVLSEFINRYAKYLAQQKFNIDINQYDKFRESKNFKMIALEVGEACKRILTIAKRISSSFELLEINSMLSLYSDNTSDFNDQVLENICITNNFKLVTNDVDFKTAKCTILTANHKLLY